MKISSGLTSCILLLCFPIFGQEINQLSKSIAAEIIPVYRHLHANPELSLEEVQTSSFLREKLDNLGFRIISPIGGYGFAGVLKNGQGPVVLVRADMDALPVKEATGASFASQVTVLNNQGQKLPVMHACGHDMHMSSWLGTAQLMASIRSQWSGTLVMVAQPAEEFGDGARKMLDGGLLQKIPEVNYALALHVSADLAAGNIGYTSGYAYANVDAMSITVYGKGGHGAYPHTTIDPIVLASRLVLALQTLVSREFSPLEPVVITVGAINGGTKGNVVPDEVTLNMTIRYHNESLRTAIIDGIRRLSVGLAKSAGLTPEEYPRMQYYPENLPGVYNDPQLTQRLKEIWLNALGSHRVHQLPATLGGEDFGRFGKTSAEIPICIFWLGAADPQLVKQQDRGVLELPSLHSSKFLPLEQPTLETGIESMSHALLGLFNN